MKNGYRKILPHGSVASSFFSKKGKNNISGNEMILEYEII